jgi:hypothetical protein
MLAVAALAGIAAGVLLWPREAGPRREGNLVLLERRGLVYGFNTTFRVESLFDAAGDPYRTRDLAKERPEEVARLRGEMLAALGLASLEEIPNDSRAWLENLEKGQPGYTGGGGERR